MRFKLQTVGSGVGSGQFVSKGHIIPSGCIHVALFHVPGTLGVAVQGNTSPAVSE